MILGIVCASPSEARSLTGCKAAVGKIYSVGPAAFLAVSGAGYDNAGKAAERLLGEGVDALLSWGLVTGLQPERCAGDVILAEELVTDAVRYKVSRSWRSALRKQLADFTRVFDGPIAHSDKVLGRPSDKQLLHDSSSAIAVDRESAAVAAKAKLAKVPFLALKVVADSASVRVPSILCARIAASGNLELGQILSSVGAKPWQWPASLKLSMGTLAALTKLEYIAEKLNRQLVPVTAEPRLKNPSLSA